MMNIGSQFTINSAARTERATQANVDADEQFKQAAKAGRNAATTDTSVVISNKAQQLLQSDSVYVVTTSKGERAVDFNTFFEPPNGPVDLNSVPILMPSLENIQALQSHISRSMPDFLQKYQIPEAPSEIKFDQQGQMVLPDDYPYGQELTEALEQEPGLMNQLRTVNMLTSVAVAMQESIRFQEEYALASSQSQIDAVIAKYHYLFDGSYRPPEVALAFSKAGELSLTADGQHVT